MSTVLGIGWACTQLGRQVLPPLLPTITDQLAISPSKAGLALTLMWGTYALVHYPGGRYSDQLSRKTVMVGGLTVMIAGFTILLTVITYPVFVVGAALVGVGAGLYFVPMRALLADLFVSRRGRALGLNLAAGMVGTVLAAGVALGVISIGRWKLAFLPVIVVLLLVLITIQRWNKESYVISWVDLGLRETMWRVFGDRSVRRLVIAYSLWAFTFQAITNFLPTYLQSIGLSATVATSGFALLFVVASVVMPIAGNLGDRIGHVPVAIVGLACSIIGLVGLLLAPTTWAILLAIVVFSAGLMAYPPVMQAYLLDIMPTANIGGDFGAFKTVYTAVGSLGPVYVGLVAERVGYAVAFGGTVTCLVLGVGLTLLVLKRR